jgi:hypothetical protein
VSAASAMKTTATVESATAANRAAVEPTRRAARKSAAAAYHPTATYESTSADITAASVEAATITPTAATPTTVPAPPWASTDKQSARKPARSVVAVRRAGVRIIIVVAVCADRFYADSDRDLCLRISQRQHQNRDQSQIFDIPHGVPPCPRSVLETHNPSNLQVFWILISLRSAYVFELGPRKKVAGAAVADFSHPA